jgi:hypothetical protein
MRMNGPWSVLILLPTDNSSQLTSIESIRSESEDKFDLVSSIFERCEVGAFTQRSLGAASWESLAPHK